PTSRGSARRRRGPGRPAAGGRGAPPRRRGSWRQPTRIPGEAGVPGCRVGFVQGTEERRMAQDVLAGRHALVTGGARGLGAGMAQALAAAGAAVMIGDVLDDLAGETARGCGGHATQLDVSDEASWEAAVAATVDQLGGLDILVNNAGIELSGLIVDAEA